MPERASCPRIFVRMARRPPSAWGKETSRPLRQTPMFSIRTVVANLFLHRQLKTAVPSGWKPFPMPVREFNERFDDIWFVEPELLWTIRGKWMRKRSEKKRIASKSQEKVQSAGSDSPPRKGGVRPKGGVSSGVSFYPCTLLGQSFQRPTGPDSR